MQLATHLRFKPHTSCYCILDDEDLMMKTIRIGELKPPWNYQSWPACTDPRKYLFIETPCSWNNLNHTCFRILYFQKLFVKQFAADLLNPLCYKSYFFKCIFIHKLQKCIRV